MFTNFTKYARFILRRERIITPIWIIAIVGFTVGLAPALNQMYGSPQELQTFASTMTNPAMVAMMGPVYGVHDYTIGAMYANTMLLWMAMGVVLMNIFFVSRHTRADEEYDRFELLRALPVGRLTNLGSVLALSLLFNLIIALLCGFGLATMNINTITLSGSLIFGAALGAVGMVYASLTAIFAQLTSTSRSTIGFGICFMLIDYMVRAAGDLGNETLARIAPLGLILRVQAYVNNEWWPVLISLIVAAVLAVLAFALLASRDLGAGLLPQRPGRKNATFILNNYFGFAFRLVRNTIFIWAIGMFVLGASYGSVFGDMDSFISGSPMLQEALIGQGTSANATETFIPFLVVVLALVSVIPVIVCINRVRTEEKDAYLDQIYGAAVSRTKVLGSYFVLGALTSALMLFVTVSGLYIASAQVLTHPLPYHLFLEAGFVYLPSLWLFLGLAMLLIAYLPRFTNLAYVYLFYTFFASYFGQILNIPDWLAKLTPFGYVPRVPVDAMNWIPMFVTTAIAAVFVIVAFVGYQKRDLVN